MIVAQLSDIHLDGSDERLRRFDSVLEWLDELHPDAIIVSGDLVEASHAQGYRIVRERLEKIGVPFYVVPGNVDEHDEMFEVFGERLGWTGERPFNCSGIVGDSLRVIGLDVKVAGAHHGDAGPVLDWLAAELNSGGSPALIFQHQHPFFCGIEGKDRNNCRNQEALSLVIGQARDTVLGTTCGHVHRPMFTRFAGLPATMAPSVTKANKLRLDGQEPNISDPPGLLVHHVQDTLLVSHVVMVG